MSGQILYYNVCQNLDLQLLALLPRTSMIPLFISSVSIWKSTQQIDVDD